MRNRSCRRSPLLALKHLSYGIFCCPGQLTTLLYCLACRISQSRRMLVRYPHQPWKALASRKLGANLEKHCFAQDEIFAQFVVEAASATFVAFVCNYLTVLQGWLNFFRKGTASCLFTKNEKKCTLLAQIESDPALRFLGYI
jgi:hypothetical protein